MSHDLFGLLKIIIIYIFMNICIMQKKILRILRMYLIFQKLFRFINITLILHMYY